MYRKRVNETSEWTSESYSSTTSKVVLAMDYYYNNETSFSNATEGNAYSKLLWNVLQGNKQQFVTKDELEASWKIVMPILEPSEIEPYEQGSCGPLGRNEFLKRAGITNAASSVGGCNNAGADVYLQSFL